MSSTVRTEVLWITTVTFLVGNGLARLGVVHLPQDVLDATLYGFVTSLGLTLWQMSTEIEREKRRLDKITENIFDVLRDHERSLRE